MHFAPKIRGGFKETTVEIRAVDMPGLNKTLLRHDSDALTSTETCIHCAPAP